jgi:putative addiction module component (TIGR02574 family)
MEGVNMSTAVDKVINEVLSLPADARIILIEKLLESLNLPTQSEIERLWADEAERRVSQIENGDVQSIPGETVFKKIHEKYRR